MIGRRFDHCCTENFARYSRVCQSTYSPFLPMLIEKGAFTGR